MTFRTLSTRWRLRGRAIILAATLCVLGPRAVLATYPLTEQERERLEKYLPRTFPKLQNRDPDSAPVHIVAIGDSVTRYVSYDGHLEDSHRAYHGVFAAELAREFFYTGGVRDVEPSKKENPEKATDSRGPEISLQNLGMNGRTAMHALSRVTTDAFVYGTDLVLINFGINDTNGESLWNFTRALRRSVEILKERGVDVILLGSSVIRDSDAFVGTARTLVFADAVRSVANETGVLFVNLADVTAGGAGIDPAASPEEARKAIFADMGRNFDHGNDADGNPIVDPLHPAEAGQRAMGEWIHEVLMHGEPAHAFKLADPRVTLGADGTAVLEFRLKNISEEARKGYLFALPNVSGLVLSASAFPFDLEPRKDQTVRIEFKTIDAAGAYLFEGHETTLRFPFFVADAQATVPVVLDVPVMPVTVAWKMGKTDGVTDAFTVEAEIVNPGAAGLAGGFEASWAGQKATGKWTAPAGGTGPLSLSFTPPLRGDAVRLRDDLRLTLTVDGGGTYRFKRGIEVTRNLAIGDTVTLGRSDLYLGGNNDGAGGAGGSVTLVPMADPKGLYLTYRISGFDLVDSPLNSAVWLDVHVDARPSTEGRPFGYTDFIRLQVRKDSPDVKIGGLRPAVFGDGYDLLLRSENLAISREILPDGSLQLILMIPRSYLYRHEWAIGNGNSILGISSRVNILEITPEIPDGTYPLQRRFALNEPDLSPHATDSLVVLELDAESTGRWTVRVY